MTAAKYTANFRVGTDGHAEPVYLCRCGEEHRGPYAVYDYRHHMCFHDAPLWDLGHGQLVCPDCGKVFTLKLPASVRSPHLSRWQQLVEYLTVIYR